MNDTILEKARKLMALRDGAATRGEAEAAARALAVMLDKYRIEVAELESKESREEVAPDQSEPLVTWKRATTWQRALYGVLCRHYGVAWWQQKVPYGRSRRGRMKYETSVFLCGRPSDVSLVRYMFAWLTGEISRISVQECAGSGRSFTMSWMLGFVRGIEEQLSSARQQVVSSSTTAIDLLSRFEQSNRVLHDKMDLKPTPYYERWYKGAFDMGKDRGKNHHLGESLDAGTHRALPASST